MNNKVVYFNAELIIDESFRRVNDVIDTREEQCEFLYINDGRKNRAEEKTEEICSINENGILVLFIGIILMFVDIIKNMFNKNEFMNFTMMMGINISKLSHTSFAKGSDPCVNLPGTSNKDSFSFSISGRPLT